jgi:predicted transcriptional regulator
VTRYEAARKWRVETMRMSRPQLAAALGYSVNSIANFETGVNSKRGKVDEAAWRRYERACAGLWFARDFKFENLSARLP